MHAPAISSILAPPQHPSGTSVRNSVRGLSQPALRGIRRGVRTALLLTASFTTATTAACGQSPNEPDPSTMSHPAPSAEHGLTTIDGLLVGHSVSERRPTGCTVVLIPRGAVGGVEQRGGAPGSRELGLLDPVNTVQTVHGVVLAGGSAFGLEAATGTVRYLEQQGIGFDVGVAKVPIVVSAILFDLKVGSDPSVRPTAECGFAAAKTAHAGPVSEGNTGVGAGATVGKMRGAQRAMKGGLGSASITTEDGLIVAALVAVNAVGDIIDPGSGRVIAGVRGEDGRSLVDARTLIKERPPQAKAGTATNTTIGVVATNADLSKAQATKFAQMADDGLSRTIYPAHTPADGDTLFSLATGSWNGRADVGRIGALGAQVVAEAILRAIEQAKSIEGYPSATELGTGRPLGQDSEKTGMENN